MSPAPEDSIPTHQELMLPILQASTHETIQPFS